MLYISDPPSPTTSAMATKGPVDWSWGQPYETPTLVSDAPIQPGGQFFGNNVPYDGTNNSSTLYHPQPVHQPNNWLTKHDYKINEFRMAVPVMKEQQVQEVASSSMIERDMNLDDPGRSVKPISRHVSNISNASKTAGRKRSCAEISDDDESTPWTRSTSSDMSSSPTKGVQMNGEDVIMDSGSQHGLWAEELAARLQSSSFPIQRDLDGTEKRPGMGESRKSIRLDREAAVSATILTRERGDSVAVMSSVPSETISNPEIDEASIALGASWTSLPLSETMLAASRGWARHIETHFPLSNARVVWKNKAMPAFLVEAVTRNLELPNRPGSPGYYLFDDELKQGRLVAKSWEKVLDNLRATPLGFEGESILDAMEIPQIETLPGAEEQNIGGMEIDS